MKSKKSSIWPAVAVGIVLLFALFATAEAKDSEIVRVAVAKAGRFMEFSADVRYQVVDQAGGRVVATVLPKERWTVENRDSRLYLSCNGNTYGPFSGSLLVQSEEMVASIVTQDGQLLENTALGNLTAINAEGKNVSLARRDRIFVRTAAGQTELSTGKQSGLLTLSPGGPSSRYRGDLLFMRENGELLAVNRVGLEDYLRGVVPVEMYSSWPTEALKAQAVVSRTYALQRIREAQKLPYDLTSDQYSQVYSGYNAEMPSTNRAVEETAGQVVMNQGRLVEAFFHSSSGGFTENSEEVWLTAEPAIKTKADPYDYNDRHYNWRVNYTSLQLIEKLRDYGDFKEITDIRLSYTTSGARVQEMTVVGTGRDGSSIKKSIANADRVRAALGLKSALFTMDKTYDGNNRISGVQIYGSGFGHGLGMSQFGAKGMADQGYSYREILHFYYTDVVIADDYGW